MTTQVDKALAAARAMRERIEQSLRDEAAKAQEFVAAWFEASDAERQGVELARVCSVEVSQGRVALLEEAVRREVLADLAALRAEVVGLVQACESSREGLAPVAIKLHSRRDELDKLLYQQKMDPKTRNRVLPDSEQIKALRSEIVQLEAQVAPLDNALASAEARLGIIQAMIKARYGVDVILRPGVYDAVLGNDKRCEGIAARFARQKAQKAQAALVDAGLVFGAH